MSRKNVRDRAWLLLPVGALILGLAGCPFSPDKDKPDNNTTTSNFKPQTSIENVLNNLKYAYVERKYDEYEKLLDANYEFAFDPDDVGPDTDFKDSWTRGDDLDSARNMFNQVANDEGHIVTDISLAFTPGTPADTPLHPAWKRVILTTVDLRLVTRNDQGLDPVIYQTPGGYEADLYFVKTDEVDPESNLGIWKIVRWEDKPPAGKTGAFAARF